MTQKQNIATVETDAVSQRAEVEEHFQRVKSRLAGLEELNTQLVGDEPVAKRTKHESMPRCY